MWFKSGRKLVGSFSYPRASSAKTLLVKEIGPGTFLKLRDRVSKE